MRYNTYLPLVLILPLLLLLAACGAPGSKKISPDTPAAELIPDEAIDLAKDYTQSGKFLDAALLYSKLAGVAAEPLKQHYQLLASEVMLDANYLVQAEQLLDEIHVDHLGALYKNRKTLQSARILLARNKPQKTLDLLEPLRNQQHEPGLQAKIHETRAKAYAKSGNMLETARERIFLEDFISDKEKRLDNQLEILNSLSRLSDLALKQLITAPPPDLLSGWLELTRITKTFQQKPELITNEIELWRKRYPKHDVPDKVIGNLLHREEIEIIKPTHIALLLPEKNHFAKAADAIKKGLLTTYFEKPQEDENGLSQRPVLQFYATDSGTESFMTVYNKAIADGADLIIGPLEKEYVNMLNERSSLQVPTLALNYSENSQRTTRNLFQFGLSPEDEASQVAERAWLSGYNSALVLVPLGNWGTRVSTSFTARWEQLGGVVAEQQTYDAKKNDFSTSIRKVLNIDESERRHSQLHATLNHKTLFTPRRRQDVDFIFIGAFPRQARQLRPQFKFHHAADLPVFATSHIYTGKINKQMDRDMNGVFFGDMPWVIPEMSTKNNLKKQINRLWPGISDKYARLFALGIDAYDLVPSLNTLLQYRAEFYRGETGNLYIDDNNRIHRRLLWLGFEKGIPVVLDSLN